MFLTIVLIAIALHFVKEDGNWWLLIWPGTVAHEAMHWIVGLLLLGNPQSFKIWPEDMKGGGQVLGSVSFANIGWWNALPIGIAPLLSVPLVWLICQNVTFHMGFQDALVVWIMAASVAQAWPSSTDWNIAYSHPGGLVAWGGIAYLALK